MSKDKDEDKARFWSVSNEDAEFTKHCIRQFILAIKLDVRPQVPKQDMDRLESIWGVLNNDIQEAEYKQLWREVEREIANGQ